MKKILFPAIMTAALLAAGGCGSPGGATIPDDDTITGTWIATRATYVSVADPNKSVDLVAQGSTVTLVMGESAFNLSIQTPGQNPTVYIGTWTQTFDGLELTPQGATSPWVFSAALGYQTLSLGGAHVTHDFGSGPEDAIFSLDFYLQP
jgi:hypothetical protein